MNGEKEIKCAGCGEIFILRSDESEYYAQRNKREPRFCPICRKEYRLKKDKERRAREDAAWKVKKAEDVKQFEEELKQWHVVALSHINPGAGDKTLYVIGNGFDLMHGAKSSYYDFDKTVGKNSHLRFCLDNYLDVDDLWADFEGALAKINVEMMCAPHILDMFLEDMEAFDKDAGMAEFYGAAEMATEPARVFATDLKKRFRDWILKLETNTDDRPLKGIIKPNGYFLNFNYTEFVEKLYGVREDKICYIHGCRKRKKGSQLEELILGHMPDASNEQYDFEDNYKVVPVSHTQMVYDAQQVALRIVSEADETITKDCGKIIENHIDFFEKMNSIERIITIGHSLYPVDWDYFGEVVSRVLDKSGLQWYLGCHGKADLERIGEFVNRFKINRDQVHIFRTDLISVKYKNDTDNAPKLRKSGNTWKTIGSSDDGRWDVLSEDNAVIIRDRESNKETFRRNISTRVNGAVFNSKGDYLFLVARGLYKGVFLLHLQDENWHYVGELEGISNQGVITKRLKHIFADGDEMVFVYNSRVRKYSMKSAELIFNKGIQNAADREYGGEDLTGLFLNYYNGNFY